MMMMDEGKEMGGELTDVWDVHRLCLRLLRFMSVVFDVLDELDRY